MNCAELEPLLVYRPLEVLEDDEAVQLESHLAQCDPCRQRLLVLEQAYQPLAEELEGELPQGLWEGVVSRLDSDDAVEISQLSEATSAPLELTVHCAFCHDGLRRPDAVYCAACLAPHHEDCFRAHGRCSTLGCEETHSVRPTSNEPARERRSRRWAWAATLVAGLGLAAWSVVPAGRDLPQASVVDRPSQTPAAPVLDHEAGAPVAGTSTTLSQPGLDVAVGGGGRAMVSRPRYAAARVLSGRVTELTQGLAVISIGVDDGVREGDEFVVWRGPEVVGRIAVQRIDREATLTTISADGGIKVGDEALLANEELVLARDQPLRVYCLDSQPRWEFRHLTRLLLRENDFELRAYQVNADPEWVQPASPGQTPLPSPLRTLGTTCDVVIAGVTSASLMPVDLQAFVEQGGGLILLPGEQGLDPAFLALSPVQDGPLEQVEPSPLALVADHPAVQTLSGVADGTVLPDLFGVRPSVSFSDDQLSLAMLADGRSLISVRRFGRGRVVYVGTDDLWRWKSVTGLYRNVWRDLLRWAGGRTKEPAAVDERPEPGAGEAPALDPRLLLEGEPEDEGPGYDDIGALVREMIFWKRGEHVLINGSEFRFLSLDNEGETPTLLLQPKSPRENRYMGQIRFRLDQVKSARRLPGARQR